ncbi:MAG: hypothetical protein HFH24_07675 [Ruminococcus sp.]|nr:hypothetical protein [Ruminococcus sp.]
MNGEEGNTGLWKFVYCYGLLLGKGRPVAKAADSVRTARRSFPEIDRRE